MFAGLTVHETNVPGGRSRISRMVLDAAPVGMLIWSKRCSPDARISSLISSASISRTLASLVRTTSLGLHDKFRIIMDCPGRSIGKEVLLYAESS